MSNQPISRPHSTRILLARARVWMSMKRKGQTEEFFADAVRFINTEYRAALIREELDRTATFGDGGGI